MLQQKKLDLAAYRPGPDIFSQEIKTMGSPCSESLTEQKLRKIFKEHDVNNDGHLNKKELKDAFRKLGAYMPGFRADRAIYYTDIDIDGAIDEHEVEQLIDYAVECGYTLD